MSNVSIASIVVMSHEIREATRRESLLEKYPFSDEPHIEALREDHFVAEVN
jgi:hypothetical protein